MLCLLYYLICNAFDNMASSDSTIITTHVLRVCTGGGRWGCVYGRGEVGEELIEYEVHGIFFLIL